MINGSLEELPGVDLGPMPEHCMSCYSRVIDSVVYRRLRICPKCRFHHSITSGRYIALLTDAGTFNESPPLFTTQMAQDALEEQYRERLQQEVTRTGATEAVITGTGEIEGVKCVIILLNFSFAGGSIGVLVGEEVARSFEWAANRKLPCVAVVTSGGERREEGILAMFQMIKTVGATRALLKKQLPYIAVLGNPCHGAAFASFVAQADVIVSEPGAAIGFALQGDGVKRADAEDEEPSDFFTAEQFAEWGQIDAVVDRAELKPTLGRLLRAVTKHGKPVKDTEADADDAPADDAGGEVESDAPAREFSLREIETAQNPNGAAYLDALFEDFVPINRHALDRRADAVICGFGRIAGEAVAAIIVNRDPDAKTAVVTANALHKATRLARLADRFNLPLITLVDNCQPATGLEQERLGVAKSISRAIATMGEVETPIIAVIIGIVGSETTLAFGIADSAAMLDNVAFMLNTQAHLPSDGESDADESPPPYFKPQECLEMGIVDAIIDTGANADNREHIVNQTRAHLIEQLKRIGAKRGEKLAQSRINRFRKLDSDYTFSEARIKRRWDFWQAGIKAAAKSIRTPTNAEPEDNAER